MRTSRERMGVADFGRTLESRLFETMIRFYGDATSNAASGCRVRSL